MTSSMELAEAERRDLLALAESLTPEQWAAPSLCAGWSVQDVVTHVVSYEDLPRTEMAKLTVQARGNPARLNDLVVERTSGTTEELLERLRRALVPTGLTAQFNGRIALTDGLIHRQDVRRPLGLGTDVPHDRLASALTFAMVAPPIRGAVRTRFLRLQATDLDWSFGRGLTVTGPGEALMMAATGRADALDELDGPGLALLRGRLERPTRQ